MRHSADSLRRWQLLVALGRGLPARLRTSANALLVEGLNALLIAVYAVTVYGLVLFVGGYSDLSVTPSLQHTLLALFLFALGVIPLNRWIRCRLDSLITSWPDDPYGVIYQLQTELNRNSSRQAIVPAVVRTITDTLKLPYGAIVSSPDDRVSVGVAPVNAERLTIPLRFADTIVGTLEVAARRPDVTFSGDELALLHNLARQVGITLHAIQLSEALEASRTQLVTAREEERRRIRRDLHDGLGPTLASLRLQLSALRHSVEPNSDAERLINELRADVRAATAEIRRLVYDLRPPMLDEFGLLGALHSLELTSDGLDRTIEAPVVLPLLPAAVEVAIYRIASEAVHNIVRHAQATRYTISMRLNQATLILTVTDNGCGLPTNYLAGVGHQSMYERAAELGGSVAILPAPTGGTCVTAVFPLKEVHNDSAADHLDR